MSDIRKMADDFRRSLGVIQAAHKSPAKVEKLKCGDCGHEVAETDNFCGLCAAPQLPVGKVALCEKHSGAPSDKFCTTCGERKRL